MGWERFGLKPGTRVEGDGQKATFERRGGGDAPGGQYLDDQHAFGNQFVQGLVRNAQARPASLAPEIANVRGSLAASQQLRSVLVPAFHGAVAALDPAAASELALDAALAYKHAQNAHAAATSRLQFGRENALTSVPDSAIDDDDGEVRLLELQAEDSILGIDLVALGAELILGLGPQTFDGKPVMGPTTVPRFGADPFDLIVSEATTTVNLMNVARAAMQTAGATQTTCAPLTETQRQQIVSLIEPFRSRPVNLAFLVRALGPGLAAQVMETSGATGQTLKATIAATEAQAKISGANNDVGDFSAEDAARLLPGDEANQGIANYFHIGDEPAATIFDEIASASPPARGAIVRQLAAMNRLDFLCQHLPYQQVKALTMEVERYDIAAGALLRPYWEDKGTGRSMNQLYTAGVDDQLEKGNTIRAFGLFLLQRIHNTFTGGFVNDSSAVAEQHNAGLISDDAASNGMAKALAKAALVQGVGALSGGLAGEAVAGAAAPLDQMLFKGAAGLVGAGAGGFVGAVGAQFAGNAFDHYADGKDWDSAASYLESGLIGMGTGLALGAVSLGASKYFPEEAQTMADVYAKRHPLMTSMLEGARKFGASTRGGIVAGGRAAGQTIAMSWRRAQELINSGGMRLAPAYATAPGGSSVPTSLIDPAANVRVTVVPVANLNQPMMSVRSDQLDMSPFEIENLEIDADYPDQGYGNSLGYDERDMSMLGDDPIESTIERQARAAGLSPTGGAIEEHHVFPQDFREWFEQRGVDIDDYVVDMNVPDHGAQHAGQNRQVTRPMGEEQAWHWNNQIMDRLYMQELELQEALGDPLAQLDEDDMVETVLQLMEERGIVEEPGVPAEFHRYARSKMPK